ncbi:MAG: hypothetical protein KDI71_22600 [Xanthomonadales bacterium]|nr:hypothetical protein [Xanthomonadales bacterium]
MTPYLISAVKSEFGLLALIDSDGRRATVLIDRDPRNIPEIVLLPGIDYFRVARLKWLGTEWQKPEDE